MQPWRNIELLRCVHVSTLPAVAEEYSSAIYLYISMYGREIFSGGSNQMGALSGKNYWGLKIK